MKLPIPVVAMEDCGAILGRRGAGKSGTGRFLLEHELTAGHRCCVIDPKGDWHGIRMLKNGKPSPYSIPIFGGSHGDLDLTEDMGETLGKMIAKHDLSCVVDLSNFPSLSAMRRFALAFATSLYKHNRAPLTLFVDEADQLAPQVVPREDNMAKLLHAMETLIRMGRQRGIFMWMLTQRPQVLNKNLLSQTETLIAMKMTTPHDQGAVRDWMKAHDPEQAKDVMASLAGLSVGEAFAWVPGADFLQRVQFPLFKTFDSGRTPKHGEKVKDVSLPKIDLSVVEQALESVKPVTVAPKKQEVMDDSLKQKVIVQLRAENIQLFEDLRSLKRQLKSKDDILTKISSLIKTQPTQISYAADSEEKVRQNKMSDVIPCPSFSSEGKGPERKPLIALVRVYPSGLTEAQWRVAAGFKMSGTWSTYKSRLRSSGMTEQRQDRFFATDAAVAATGAVPDMPSPGPELVRWWAGKLQAVSPMAEAFISAYPDWLSKEVLAEKLGMSCFSGTFSTYLSRLSGPGLIEKNGKLIRLSTEVMES